MHKQGCPECGSQSRFLHALDCISITPVTYAATRVVLGRMTSTKESMKQCQAVSRSGSIK